MDGQGTRNGARATASAAALAAPRPSSQSRDAGVARLQGPLPTKMGPCPPDCGYCRACREGRCVPVHPCPGRLSNPGSSVWWGSGHPREWQWRSRSTPAVGITPGAGPAGWGAFQYQGGFWPWNGTAPYPGRHWNPEGTGQVLLDPYHTTRAAPRFRTRNPGVYRVKERLANPAPVYPGPGAHSPTAPLPPQWFYYTSASTAGAPAAPGVQVASPGPPPGVYGRGGQCYNDRDCRENEYCHGGICLPKPWAGQATGIIEPNPSPWVVTFPTKKALAGRPGRRRNPEGMVSLTQPLAPGFQLR
jgi:hypothetical protein